MDINEAEKFAREAHEMLNAEITRFGFDEKHSHIAHASLDEKLRAAGFPMDEIAKMQSERDTQIVALPEGSNGRWELLSGDDFHFLRQCGIRVLED